MRQLYLVRYAILALGAGLLAYPLSFVLTPLLTKAFTPYVGLWRSPALTFLAPLAAVLLAVLIVIGYCSIIFRRTRRISPVAALRGLKLATPAARGLNARPSFLGVHTWFGLARLRVNRSSALTLLVVLALAIAIAVTPLKLHSTLSAPNFITYPIWASDRATCASMQRRKVRLEPS